MGDKKVCSEQIESAPVSVARVQVHGQGQPESLVIPRGPVA